MGVDPIKDRRTPRAHFKHLGSFRTHRLEAFSASESSQRSTVDERWLVSAAPVSADLNSAGARPMRGAGRLRMRLAATRRVGRWVGGQGAAVPQEHRPDGG